VAFSDKEKRIVMRELGDEMGARVQRLFLNGVSEIQIVFRIINEFSVDVKPLITVIRKNKFDIYKYEDDFEEFVRNLARNRIKRIEIKRRYAGRPIREMEERAYDARDLNRLRDFEGKLDQREREAQRKEEIRRGLADSKAPKWHPSVRETKAFTSEEKRALITTLGYNIRDWAHRLFTKGNHPTDIINKLTEKYTNVAKNVIGRSDFDYKEFREFLEEYIGPYLEDLHSGSPLEKLKRAEYRMETPEQRRKRRAEEREWKTMIENASEKRLKEEEYSLLNKDTKKGHGRIIVKVKNDSEKTAYDVVISCSGEPNSPSYTVRKGKSVLHPFDVRWNTFHTVICSSSSHDLEPDEEEVVIKASETRKNHWRVHNPIERKNFTLKTKKKREDIGKIVKEKRLKIRKGRGDYLNRILGTLGLLTVGFIISAIIGSPWLVISFLAFGAHVAIPPTDIGRGVSKKMHAIKKKYESLIEQAEKSYEKDREKRDKIIDGLYKRMESELRVETMVDRTSTLPVVGNVRGFKNFKIPSSKHAGREFGREFLKAVGFISMMVAFVWSTIPLAPVVGIIIGFAGYFLLGGSDYHIEEKKGRK